MVTLNSYGNAPKRNDCLFWGLSTDAKPIEFYVDETGKRTAIENGSIFIAMDIMEASLYDAENKKWCLFTVGGNNSGGTTSQNETISEQEIDGIISGEVIDEDSEIPVGELTKEYIDSIF